MTLLQLFWGFLKVGCFSFGGAYAAIPLIRDAVLAYGWLSAEMLGDMIAVSESTPGPIMVNLATYAGAVRAGIPGALIATFAVALPAFLIILLISAVMDRVLENRYVQAALDGIKAAVTGIILATGCHMLLQNLFNGSIRALDARAALLAAGLVAVWYGVYFLRKKRMSPILLILLAAAAGMAVYGI